jgi:hypothetical protein
VIYVLLGEGDGGFRSPVTFAAGTRPNAAIAADVNGDGTPDIITANRDDDSITVLTMDACGGMPGEARPTVCVEGASCSGQISWESSAGVDSPRCTLLCDCPTSGGCIAKRGVRDVRGKASVATFLAATGSAVRWLR